MALLLLSVVLTILNFAWTHQEYSKGFPTLNDVRANGAIMVQTEKFDPINLTLYPSMTFTCSGNITKLRFLAMRGRGDHELNIGLATRLAMPADQGTYVAPFNITDFSNAQHTGGSGTGYETNFSCREMEFHDGDILAVRQQPSRLRLLYQVGEKIDACCFSTPNYWWGSITCNKHHYRPLVTIETDHPECVHGFISVAAFEHVMAATELYSNSFEMHFFGLVFNCPSSIKKWTIGAQITKHQNASRILVGNLRTEISFVLNPLNTTSYINVYEHRPNQNIVTSKGLHISVQSSQIYYQHCALPDCQPRPLIAVNSACRSCSDEECTRGFISLEELREKARYIPNFVNVSDQTLYFPHMTITKDGYIVKLTFTAEKHQLASNHSWLEYPQLSILSSNYKYNSSMSISCSESDVMHCINISSANTTPYPNVYEVTFPAVQVSAGDYIAVYQPDYSKAGMLLKFVNFRTPKQQEINFNNSSTIRSRKQPLIHLEIVEKPQSIQVPSTVLVTGECSIRISPTPSLNETSPTPSLTGSSTDSSTTSSNIGPIIGGITATIVLITVAVAIVLVVAIMIYMKKKKRKNQKSGTSNPTYDCNSSGVAAQVIYAEPSMDHPITANTSTIVSTSPSSSLEPHYSVPSEVYTEPQVTKRIGTLSNPEYFYTQPKGHYEFAIYVPTKEQREQLTSNSHVYATLEEAQVDESKGDIKFFEEADIYWDPASSKEGLYEQLSYRKYREIPAHQLQLKEVLGSGEFGTVNRGIWQYGNECVEVAVKKLQENCSEVDTIRFLQEAAIIGQFRHSNIIQLYGVVTVGEPVMIVTEIAENGDLRVYLLNKLQPDPGEMPLPDTAGMLLQFCLQVARGMEYLSSKAFVHRDLAARNILITDDKTCKIGDFGMSHDLVDDSYYVSHGGKIPVKWTAPEALHLRKYSTASDVWSFGCLMYEIWSLGHKPFEGYTNIEAVQLVDGGKRLPPPAGCPKEIYQLMINCWNADKSSRPQFSDIVHTLSQSEDQLLYIPDGVTRDHPQAAILGAPLEAGRNLYTQLQNTYLPQSSS